MNFKVSRKWHRKVNCSFLLVRLIRRVFLVDTNELQRVLNEIKGRVNSAQTDLDNAKNAGAEGASADRFANVMEVRVLR